MHEISSERITRHLDSLSRDQLQEAYADRGFEVDGTWLEMAGDALWEDGYSTAIVLRDGRAFRWEPRSGWRDADPDDYLTDQGLAYWGTSELAPDATCGNEEGR